MENECKRISHSGIWYLATNEYSNAMSARDMFQPHLGVSAVTDKYDAMLLGRGMFYSFALSNTFYLVCFAGVIYDVSKSYQIAFYAAGASATLATCILFLVPVLMPVETCQDGRARTEYELQTEKTPLDGILSPDSSNPTTSTQTSLGSCQRLNSEGLPTRGQSYIDRYWDMPKRASMASLLSLKFFPVPPVGEVLLVVDRVSQV